MAHMRLDPCIRKYAESMQIRRKELGLHDDSDQSLLYARAKEGLNVIADNILTDGDKLVDNCANIGLIMMMLADNDREQHPHPVELARLAKLELERLNE